MLLVPGPSRSRRGARTVKRSGPGRVGSREETGMEPEEEGKWEAFLRRSCWSMLKRKNFEGILKLCVALGGAEESTLRVLPASTILKDAARLASPPSLALQLLDQFPEHASRKHHTQLLRRSLAEGLDFSETELIFRHCLEAYDSGLEDTKREEQRPDDVVFAEFISACERAGREEEGLRAFADCVRLGKRRNPATSPLPHQGHGPCSTLVCNAVLSLLHANPETCESFFDNFVRQGLRPDCETMNTMMRSALKRGNPQRCEVLYDDLRDLGIEPTMSTFSLLVESYGAQGKHVRAQHVVNQMQSLSLKPTHEVWLSVLSVTAKRGDPHLTQRMWVRIRRSLAACGETPTLEMAKIVMRSALVPGEGHLVLETLKDLEEAGHKPDHESRCLAVRACAFLNTNGKATGEDLGRAAGQVALMGDEAPDARAVLALLSMALDAGEPDKFTEILGLARDAGLSQDDEISALLARHALALGDLPGAWDVYESHWYRWTGRDGRQVFEALLEEAVSREEFSRAFAVARHMRSLGHKPSERLASSLDDALVEYRLSHPDLCLLVEKDLWGGQGSGGKGGGGGDGRVLRVHHGTTREVRFQVLSALNSLRRDPEVTELRLDLGSSLDCQVVVSLLESDLGLDVETAEGGRQVVVKV